MIKTVLFLLPMLKAGPESKAPFLREIVYGIGSRIYGYQGKNKN